MGASRGCTCPAGSVRRNQPVKVAALTVAGLGLSTASGRNTWLMHRVFRARG